MLNKKVCERCYTKRGFNWSSFVFEFPDLHILTDLHIRHEQGQTKMELGFFRNCWVADDLWDKRNQVLCVKHIQGLDSLGLHNGAIVLDVGGKIPPGCDYCLEHLMKEQEYEVG